MHEEGGREKVRGRKGMKEEASGGYEGRSSEEQGGKEEG